MKIELPLVKKPFKTKTGYTNFIKRHFEKLGFTIYQSKRDDGNNCIYCGESGRCPGIHGIKFDYYMGTSDEF